MSKIFVVSGPSGAGKGTILKRLREVCPSIVTTVSCTTRSPRPGEENGKDYYFLSRCKFEEGVRNGDFLEYAEYSGNLYGTLKQEIDSIVSQMGIPILEIEVQGAQQVRENVEELPYRCCFIFIAPPSVDELERRLRSRGTESEESINARLGRAKVELKEKNKYDYVIVNDEAERAAAELFEIIKY